VIPYVILIQSGSSKSHNTYLKDTNKYIQEFTEIRKRVKRIKKSIVFLMNIYMVEAQKNSVGLI
jgi:hypothetical protein